MAKVRVHELAKKYDVPSKDVLTMLNDLGEFVKAPSSTVEPPVEKQFEDKYGADLLAKAEAKAAKKAAKKAPAKKAAAAPAEAEAQPTPCREPSPAAEEPAAEEPAGRSSSRGPRPAQDGRGASGADAETGQPSAEPDYDAPERACRPAGQRGRRRRCRTRSQCRCRLQARPAPGPSRRTPTRQQPVLLDPGHG